MSEPIRPQEADASGTGETSRRALLGNLAAAALTGALSDEAAAQVHQHVAAEKKAAARPAAGAAPSPAGGPAADPYKPKLLTAHEFESLAVLSEIIIPGARAAGAAEFVDLLASNNAEFAARFTGGLLWLDHEFDRRFRTTFLKATVAQRTEVLDLIAYLRNHTPELGPGIAFVDLARRLASDAYFTSREGVKEIGFLGNQAVTAFEVPQNVLDHVNRRSPV